VDRDVSILEYNAAAAQLLGNDRQTLIGRRNGDVLHCVHASEAPGGCGCAAACLDCVVRESVRTAADGRAVVRRPARMELETRGQRKEVDLRISCQPFTYEQQSLILLMLEGLND
jgi:hypothetical protein